LVQNALDSQSPFVYEFKKQDDGSTTFILNSAFTVLTPNTLLLGATSKADDAKAIGSFGEGFKIALLVLTRMGYSVDMYNGHNLWKPKFQYSKTYEDDLLVVEESPLSSKRNKGLTFHVHGLTQTDVDDLIKSCIRMQSHIGAIKQTKFGDILLEQKGKLYVGGLYICDTELHYGYNILPEYMKLERDRQTVVDWDLKTYARDMWFETGEAERIAKMIEDDVPDMKFASWSSPPMVKEACYRLFRAKYPDKLIAGSADELDKLVKEGMTNVVFVGSSMYSNVAASTSYRADMSYRAPRPLIQPSEYLTQWLSANRKEMRAKAIIAFKDIIEESKKWSKK
jgi:hypothetical protein